LDGISSTWPARGRAAQQNGEVGKRKQVENCSFGNAKRFLRALSSRSGRDYEACREPTIPFNDNGQFRFSQSSAYHRFCSKIAVDCEGAEHIINAEFLNDKIQQLFLTCAAILHAEPGVVFVEQEF
jgi:hypothetical protein